MRLLLDTCAFLDLHTEPERLGVHLEALEDPNNTRLVSAVVTWEVTIKHSLGRLTLPAPPQVWVPEMISVGAMNALPIELSHTLAVGTLGDHHRDPFDRLLIATALVSNLPVVTSDAVFESYPIEVLRY